MTERTPNFIGMTKEEVIPHLYPYKIEWHGEGEKVIQQVPSADSLILQSGSVHLYLGD